MQAKKTLVAYFSASGTTAKLARTLAEAIGADLYEIRPQQPYTKADLDWNDRKSRSTVEMRDRHSRPGIAGRVENMDQYQRVFVGFPIWWYTAPTIINSFLEGYQLSGKQVIPFATSGGSGMERVNASLQGSCPGAELCQGRRFPGGAKAGELRSWAEKV